MLGLVPSAWYRVGSTGPVTHLGTQGGDRGRQELAVMTWHPHAPGILFTHLGELGEVKVLLMIVSLLNVN